MSSLYTVKILTSSPTLTDAARSLQLPISALDTSFGVVLIDPKRHLYTVKSNADNVDVPDPNNGPYADPVIGGFGPIR